MKKIKKRKKTHVLPTKAKLGQRIALITLAMGFIFIGLMFRVISIAVFKKEEYAQGILENMKQREGKIEAPRGTIQDINGKTMAASLLRYNIILSPYEIVNHVVKDEERLEIYETLATQLNQNAKEIQLEVEKRANQSTGNKYYLIARNVDSETAEPLKSLGGVTVARTYIRNYPNGELAAQVIGFFNKNGEGQYGVEEQYNSYLEGKAGRSFYQTEKYNMTTQVVQEPVAGATVTLTIDSVIQKYVTDAMTKYIKQVKPESATAIIMNPKTAEIKGMYSYPSFDPNVYNDLSGQIGQSWTNLSQQQQSTRLLSAWKNNAIQLNYEPGSTFKPLVVAIALEEGVISGNETYDCKGSKNVSGTTIGCWKHEGHGIQTLGEALANSCNVALMDIGEKVDPAKFMQYVKNYGFGQKTGIELAGEEKGQLHQVLGTVERATYSIGQGLTVTPIQLISAFSSVINGGYLMEPYVVSEITDANGKVLLKQDAKVRHQIISTDIANNVRDTLKKVVDEGTGTKAAISGYEIGGKTGTGQEWLVKDGKIVTDEKGKPLRDEENYAISFMGFAPVEDPEVIGLIVFDKIPEGTGVQTLAFKEMMENIFPYLGIPTSTSSDTEDDTIVKVPQVTNQTIYEAIAHLNTTSLNYKILGSGIQVVEQYPSAGSIWDKEGNVTLYTKTQQPERLVEVPNLIGQTIEDARLMVGDKLKIAGEGKGKIISQFPNPGYKIEMGNKIIIQTSE